MANRGAPHENWPRPHILHLATKAVAILQEIGRNPKPPGGRAHRTVFLRQPPVARHLAAGSKFYILKLLLIQLVEQRLGVLQVCGVEAFGEPVVDLREHLSGFVAPIRITQQACETQGGTQFK